MTEPVREHVLHELGFDVVRAGDEMHGSAPIVAAMHVPGTSSVRLSILAAWADTLTGLLTLERLAPRIPTTLELDVHAYRPPCDCGTIQAAGRIVKAGQSVVVAAVHFADASGEPVAFSTVSFTAIPGVSREVPPEILGLVNRPGARPLRVPFAERAGCERREAGVAVLPWSAGVLNSSGNVTGGLLALAAEEAALSLTPGATLASLAVRFLAPVRLGPGVATADVRSGLGRVEVRDAGADDRLAVLATTRTFAGPRGPVAPVR